MKLNQLISKRTRQLMREREWTQYKLSQRSAIPLSTLSNTINCKSSTIMLETLINICRGFDISVADFFNVDLFSPENISDD